MSDTTTKNLQYNVGVAFKTDGSENLNKVNNEITGISQSLSEADQKIKKAFMNFGDQTGKAFDSVTASTKRSTATYDELYNSLIKTNATNKDCYKEVNALTKAYDNFTNTSLKDFNNNFDTLQQTTIKTNSWMDKLGTTILNTFRYQIVNKFTDALMEGLGSIVQYLEDVDESLTQISIVSGKSRTSLAGFLKTAEDAAKSLGSTTSNYLEAAQIFYQQGLSTADVIDRTNATIKAANISGQSVSDTASQVTAVLNGFNLQGSEINDTLSVMAALGATTAADFEQLATAAQKVASAASNVGLSLNGTMSAITTIESVTQESAESIGTSLNAIIGRYNKLTLTGDGATSTIEKTLQQANAGFSVFDQQSGQIRDFESVLTDIAGVWDTLDANSQRALTTAIAGTRQSNRLIALLDNWDQYERNMKTAEVAEGSLDAQNAVYKQSLEAIKNMQESSSFQMWNELFDEDMLKGFYSLITEITDTLGDLFDKAGGFLPVVTRIVAVLNPIITKMAQPVMAKVLTYFSNFSTHSAFSKNSEAVSGYNNSKALSERNLPKENNELNENRILGDVFESLGMSRDTKIQNVSNMSAQAAEEYKKLLSVVQERYNTEFNILKENENAKKIILETNRLLQDQEDLLNKTDYSQDPLTIKYKDTLKKNKGKGDFTLDTTGLIKRSGDKFDYTDEDVDKVKLAQTLKDQGKGHSEVQVGKIAKQIATEATTASYNTYNKSMLESFQNTNLEGADFSKSSDLVRSIFGDNTKDIINSLTDKDNNPWEVYDDTKKEDLKAALDELTATLKKQGIEVEQKDATLPQDKGTQLDAQNRDQLAKTDQKAKKISAITTATITSIGILTNSIKTLGDTSLTTSEKAVQISSSIGSGLSSIGSVMATSSSPTLKTIGMVTSIIGQAVPFIADLLAEAGAFDTQAEKLKKEIDAASESIEKQTKLISEERAALSNVVTLADDLAKKYKAQAFSLSSLTEEEKTNYDQVAEYCATYAPNLIKYYDSEGNAVIDLTKLYGELNNTKRNYLEQEALENQGKNYIQSGATNLAGKRGSNLIEQASLANIEIKKIQEQIQEISNKDTALTAKEEEKIKSLNEKLTEQQNIISSIGSNWNDQVINPTLIADENYQQMNGTLQDMIYSVSDYNTYLAMGYQDVDDFTNSLREMMSYIADNQNLVDKFTSMSTEISTAVLNIAQSFKLQGDGLQNYLSTVTEENFVDISRINDLVQLSKRSEINDYQHQQDLYNAQKQNNINEATKKAEHYKEDYSGYYTSDDDLDAAAQVYYNDILSTKDALLTMPDIYDELSEKQKQWAEDAGMSAEEIQNSFKQSTASINQYIRSLRKISSTDSGYNTLVNSYIKAQKQIDEADGDLKDQLIDRKDELYSVLMGEDEDYYTEWKKLNKSQTKHNSQQMNIQAEDYSNLNEYREALDSAYDKFNEAMQTHLGDSSTDFIQAVENYKRNQKIMTLTQEGKTTEAAIELAKTENLSKEDLAALETRSRMLEDANQLQSQADKYAAMESGTRLTAEDMAGIYDTLDEHTQEGLLKYGVDVGNTINSADFWTAGQASKILADEAQRMKDAADAITLSESGQAAVKAAEDSISELQGLLQDSIDYNNSVSITKAPEFKTSDTADTTEDTTSSGSGSTNEEKFGGEAIDFDIDPLKPYEDKLTEIEHTTSDLAAERERLYGEKYVDLLQQEADLHQENLNTLRAELEAAKKVGKQKQEDAEKELKNLKDIAANTGSLGIKDDDGNLIAPQLAAIASEMGNVSLTFDEATGRITNYNEVLEQLESVSAKISDESAGINSDWVDEYNDRLESFKDKMDEYEEYAAEKGNDIEESIQDAIDTIIDNQIEQIEYPIKIVIEASDNDKNYLDYLASYNKNKKGTINFSVESSSELDKLLLSLSESKELIEKAGGTSAQDLIAMLQSGELGAADAKLIEAIREEEGNFQDVASDLMEIIENLDKAFKEGLDNASSTLSEALDKFNDSTTWFNNTLTMMEQAQTDTVDTITALGSSIIGIDDKKLKELETFGTNLIAIRDQFQEGTDEWATANEAVLANLVKQQEIQSDILSKYNTMITSSITQNQEDIERSLFGGMTAQEYQDTLKNATTERDRYLTTEKQIYGISKLENTIQADIDKSSTGSAAQARLKKFMDSEIDYLKNKKKLKQDDLDLSTKQYNVLKAQIELEEAQDAKNYSRILQRNTGGNYGYMYVKDTSAITTARQKYEDSINDYYAYVLKELDTYNTEFTTVGADYAKNISSILQDYQKGNINQEEAQAKIDKEQESYLAKRVEIQQKIKEYAQQVAGSTELQKESQDGITAKVKEMVDSMMNGDVQDTFNDYYNKLTGSDLDTDVFTIMDNGIVSLNKDWKKFADAVKTDIGSSDLNNLTGTGSILDNITNYLERLAEFADSAKAAADSINNSGLLNDIAGDASDVNTAVNKELQAIADTIDKYNEMNTTVTETVDGLKQLIDTLHTLGVGTETENGVDVSTSTLAAGLASQALGADAVLGSSIATGTQSLNQINTGLAGVGGASISNSYVFNNEFSDIESTEIVKAITELPLVAEQNLNKA